MRISPSDISIAVTCHRRLDFLEEALASALAQTRPVNVWLQDNASDQPERLAAIRDRAGPQLGYRRTPQALTMFGNMNACIAACPTPWLSILHDDDTLAPDFVERVITAAADAPPAALYFGGTRYLDPAGRLLRRRALPDGEPWRTIELGTFARTNLFAFPGQLMHVETARAVGGFPRHGSYTGDWDLWFRLALAGGAVQVGADVARYRCHGGARATVDLQRAGRKIPVTAMQARVNAARLRQSGRPGVFDRSLFVRENPLRYRETVLAAAHWSRRMLRYHRRMLLATSPVSRRQHWIRRWTRVTGIGGLRLLAWACLALKHTGLSHLIRP